MELVPWRRFQEFGSLRLEMDDMWKSFLGEIADHRPRTEKWIPSMDITEKEDHILVAVELPGLEPGDVDIRITGDLLKIQGEKKREEVVEPENRCCCREIRSGAFHRTFRLPSDVQGENVNAVFKNGVLKMFLPKTKASERKRIRIPVHA
ncbi:MAG: Hsp20/alpha crystallin family protein [Desulfobacteraceae bacterium]|nr:MAG: Hsp20/alpha crystallin family protein [Desulfobacteraceae bacterium]